jgi:glycerol-3-phosphate dehydrogenase (NAD(P)+)
MKLTVIAAGAWGTALAIAFARQHTVTLWSREIEVADDIKSTGINQRFLPGFTIPKTVSVVTDLPRSLFGADLLIVATPIIGLRDTLKICASLAPDTPLLWVCKGFEAGTGLLPHQLATQILGSKHPFGALSGPSFAQEVAAAKPTALSLACSPTHIELFQSIALQLHDTALRIYPVDDIVGVEVGGAVKNVLAIATGICDGLQLGLNARAALITRGLAEIARLGQALGARRETLMGLAGMGDLILTCTGDLSRNRRVGLALAEGKNIQQILTDLGHVAEGVPTALEVAGLAERLNVDMPISHAVAAVIEGKQDIKTAVASLMARDPRHEQL